MCIRDRTTTCVNLAAALKNQGCRVLVCDFDPQANTTSGFGVDKTTSPNIYDVLLNGTETAKAISDVYKRQLPLLPEIRQAQAGRGLLVSPPGLRPRGGPVLFLRPGN